MTPGSISPVLVGHGIWFEWRMVMTPGFTSPVWIGWALVLNVCSIGRLWHLVSHLPCRNVSLLLDVSIADKLLNRYSKCSCLVEAVCVCVWGGGGFRVHACVCSTHFRKAVVQGSQLFPFSGMLYIYKTYSFLGNHDGSILVKMTFGDLL